MISEAIQKMQEAIERTVAFLGNRKRAYQFCFPKNGLHTDIVLKDLSRYCHINEECPHTDPFEIGQWMGRRSVFLRVQRHLYLTPEELFAIYSGVRNKEH